MAFYKESGAARAFRRCLSPHSKEISPFSVFSCFFEYSMVKKQILKIL